MKKLIPLLLLLVLAGCATASKYQLQITEYEKPLPKYPLKASVYYKPNVKDSQLFEMEYNQFGSNALGTFKAGYGAITFTKFNSAFSKMFRETERSLVADRPTRLLEAQSKNTDLLCDIEFSDYSFDSKQKEGFMEGMVKGMFNPFPRKIEYSAESKFNIKLSFYKPDGSVVLEKTYPYSVAESIYYDMAGCLMALYEASNEQIKKGVDEIIGRMSDNLKYSDSFIELVNARAQGKI